MRYSTKGEHEKAIFKNGLKEKTFSLLNASIGVVANELTADNTINY